MRNAVKIALIAGYLAAGSRGYLERIADLRDAGPALIVVYAGLFAILAAALFLSAFIRSGPLRWIHAVLFTVAAVFFDSYLRITGDFLAYDNFVSQVYSFGFVDEAMDQFRSSIAWAAATGLLLLAGIGARPGRGKAARAGARGWVAAAIAVSPALAVTLLATIMFTRGGDGGRGLPVMFTPLAYAGLISYEALTRTIGPREEVSLARDPKPIGHDIVFIVDESVAGNYLDINSPRGVATPLTHPPSGVRVYNFGYAAAIANCSADVNVTLRFGGTRGNYVAINARMPSIWQYAKAAGLRTVYVDAQRTGGRLQNLMTEAELKAVDSWVQFDGVPVRDRDMAAAAKLAELTANGIPELVFVNKMGAHFPVHDKYPDEFMAYRPALPRGGYEEVADTGSRLGFGGTAADWASYRNSYRNTLLWSVGEFFGRLFATADLDKAVVLYTSDHGQDLHERGNPGLNTHCGASPVAEEGLVPLVVIQGAKLRTLDWGANLGRNHDRSSHYNIFPTLLQLMGYDVAAVTKLYGNPLSTETKDPFTFNSRFNARLGAQPRWEFIDLSRLSTPSPPPPVSARSSP